MQHQLFKGHLQNMLVVTLWSCAAQKMKFSTKDFFNECY